MLPRPPRSTLFPTRRSSDLVVDGNPDLRGFVLPHEDLERQVDGRFRRRLHHAGAGSRAAEDQEGRGPQRQPRAHGFLLLIDGDEEREVTAPNFRPQPCERLFIAEPARDTDHTARFGHESVPTLIIMRFLCSAVVDTFSPAPELWLRTVDSDVSTAQPARPPPQRLVTVLAV